MTLGIILDFSMECVIMKKKVIAAGHICLDTTPVFPGEKVKKPEDPPSR